MKTFEPKNGHGDGGPDVSRNAERDLRGEKRSNEAHVSSTYPDARLCKKADGRPSRLCFVGTALMENRNGRVVDGRLRRFECLAAVDLADAHLRPGGTLAGEKGLDTAEFVAELGDRRSTPHVAQSAYDTGKAKRWSTIDRRTTRHVGYAVNKYPRQSRGF